MRANAPNDDLRRCSYLSETLMNRKLYLPMLEEWASDEMGQVRKKKNQPTQVGILLPGEKVLDDPRAADARVRGCVETHGR